MLRWAHTGTFRQESVGSLRLEPSQVILIVAHFCYSLLVARCDRVIDAWLSTRCIESKWGSLSVCDFPRINGIYPTLIKIRHHVHQNYDLRPYSSHQTSNLLCSNDTIWKLYEDLKDLTLCARKAIWIINELKKKKKVDANQSEPWPLTFGLLCERLTLYATIATAGVVAA